MMCPSMGSNGGHDKDKYLKSVRDMCMASQEEMIINEF